MTQSAISLISGGLLQDVPAEDLGWLPATAVACYQFTKPAGNGCLGHSTAGKTHARKFCVGLLRLHCICTIVLR